MRYFKKENKGKEAEESIPVKCCKERRELSDKLTNIFFYCLRKQCLIISAELPVLNSVIYV